MINRCKEQRKWKMWGQKMESRRACVKTESSTNLAYIMEKEIKDFAATSGLNSMPETKTENLSSINLWYNLLTGNDPLFTQYKTIIAPCASDTC